MARSLRLVLGDQLSDGLSSLRDLQPEDTVLMVEVLDEATYVPHHKQKLIMVFAAMRRFGARLASRGVAVRYVSLTDPSNTHSLDGEVLRALGEAAYDRVVVCEPGEWRLVRLLDALALKSPVPVTLLSDDRFICPRGDFEAWAKPRSELRMESFYRRMRRETGLLMQGERPFGGRWNFDAENRRRPPRELRAPAAPPRVLDPVVRTVMALVEDRFPGHFGDADSFAWATSHDEAEADFADFLAHRLPGFGDWQDAMRAGEPFLWHARISAALNIGLLDPLPVCRRAEAEYLAGRAPLNAVEGFIRQVLGWREFVRGVYWLKGEDYLRTNALAADRRLPGYFWSGETDMACLRDVVTTTRQNAYAHHIQRLMVAGNLALLLGVHPGEVNHWYMVVYIDAFEWVEAPNTHGMAIFADGGMVGSKPYAASGAYIHRMSDYCSSCLYDVQQKTGPSACPFNRLYWDFLLRNEARLSANPRLALPYRALRAMGSRHDLIRKEADDLRMHLGATPVA